jgi:hypothetical protein
MNVLGRTPPTPARAENVVGLSREFKTSELQTFRKNFRREASDLRLESLGIGRGGCSKERRRRLPRFANLEGDDRRWAPVVRFPSAPVASALALLKRRNEAPSMAGTAQWTALAGSSS